MGSVSKEVLQEHIIGAIDLIKGKRARPDQQRITEQVIKSLTKNRGSLSEVQFKKRILSELESAVVDGKVIKVRYKDGISYRNPATVTIVHLGTSKGSNGQESCQSDQQEHQQQGNGKQAAATIRSITNVTNVSNDRKDVQGNGNGKKDGKEKVKLSANHDVNSGKCECNATDIF